MKVYWIRHGETDFNRQGIVQGGGIDAPLNSIGQAQAQALFDTYQALKIDAVYTSALQRTQLTLAPWQQAGHSLIIRKELNELGWGDLEGQPSTDQTRQLFGRIVNAWSMGELDARMPNGESAADAWSRVAPFIRHLETSHAPQETILVCTHGRLLRIILSQILGGGLHAMEQYPNDNTGVSITHYMPQTGWSAKQLNCTDHLKSNDLETFYARYH